MEQLNGVFFFFFDNIIKVHHHPTLIAIYSLFNCCPFKVLTIEVVHIVDANLTIETLLPPVRQFMAYAIRKRLCFGIAGNNKMEFNHTVQ